MADLKTKYIKVQKTDGTYHFLPHNAYNLQSVEQQNDKRSDKYEVSVLELTDLEYSKLDGFDEKAGLRLNPTALKLATENDAQASRIAELEAELAKTKVKKIKDGE